MEVDWLGLGLLFGPVLIAWIVRVSVSRAYAGRPDSTVPPTVGWAATVFVGLWLFGWLVLEMVADAISFVVLASGHGPLAKLLGGLSLIACLVGTAVYLLVRPQRLPALLMKLTRTMMGFHVRPLTDEANAAAVWVVRAVGVLVLAYAGYLALLVARVVA